MKICIVTNNRFRSNYYNLSALLQRVGSIQNPKCSCSSYDQDLNHIVWQCRLFDFERMLVKQSYKNQDDVTAYRKNVDG